MRIFDGFDEIKSAVGSEIGVSDWIDITQDRINRFAEATCDQQWIHVDQERAKGELPGGLTIAHGLLSLSLAPLFIRSVMGLKGLRNTSTMAPIGFDTLHPCPPAPGHGAEPQSVKPWTCRRTVCGSITIWSSRSRAVSAPPASPT
jgi:acyl dehydratase